MKSEDYAKQCVAKKVIPLGFFHRLDGITWPMCEGVNVIFDYILCFSSFFLLQSLVMCYVRVRIGPVSNCTKWLNPSGWCYIIRCIIYVYVWLMIQSCDITWIYSWVPINSTGKVCNGWIRNLGSIPAYTKNRLMSWSDDKELFLGADAISWKQSQKK